MNYSYYRITLDIQAMGSSVLLNAKKGDTGRKIYITLTDGGSPYHITEDCYAAFTGTKPDGHTVFHECTIEGCTIIYTIKEQTLAVAGRVKSEIKLYGANGMLLTSACFALVVDGTVYAEGDEIESTDDFSALTDLITQTQTLKSELVTLKDQLVALKNDLENGTSVTVREVTLFANKWVGADSPYSQVINIAGVTARSQVDLKPSVEQMEIFHDKDLAFVTENEAGVVTVYAIGEKPANDYTMQVTITEVNV